MNGKARIGMIGAGRWLTENHIPLLKEREDAELAAVCRRDSAKLRQVNKQFGFEFATEDYREMLHLMPPDGVIAGSPHDVHYGYAEVALEQDSHVMVENPWPRGRKTPGNSSNLPSKEIGRSSSRTARTSGLTRGRRAAW